MNFTDGDLGVTCAHHGDTRSAFGKQDECKAVTEGGLKTIWASERKMSRKNYCRAKSDLHHQSFANPKVFLAQVRLHHILGLPVRLRLFFRPKNIQTFRILRLANFSCRPGNLRLTHHELFRELQRITEPL